jgi:hypothetical protein
LFADTVLVGVSMFGVPLPPVTVPPVLTPALTVISKGVSSVVTKASSEADASSLEWRVVIDNNALEWCIIVGDESGFARHARHSNTHGRAGDERG